MTFYFASTNGGESINCGKCGQPRVRSTTSRRLICRPCNHAAKMASKRRLRAKARAESAPAQVAIDHSRCKPGGAMCPECAAIWSEVQQREVMA